MSIINKKQTIVNIKELKNKLNQDEFNSTHLFELAKLNDSKYIKNCIKLLIDKLTQDQLFELAKLIDNKYIYTCIKLLVDKLSPDQLFELAKSNDSKYIKNCIKLLINKLSSDQFFELAKLSYSKYIIDCIKLLIDKLTIYQLFELAKLSHNCYIHDCIKLLIDKLTPDKLFELAKLSSSNWIIDCIKLLIDKLTTDKLLELAKLSYNGVIKNCIELLIDKLTLDQLLELVKLSDEKLQCLNIIRTNKEISIETLINLGFEEYLTNDIIYMIFKQYVFPKLTDVKPEFKNKLDELTWLTHLGHIEASAYEVIHEPNDIFDFIHSKQNNVEDKSELDMITLLHKLIYEDKKIHYDDASELKRYLDIIREETKDGIIKLSIN